MVGRVVLIKRGRWNKWKSSFESGVLINRNGQNEWYFFIGIGTAEMQLWCTE